MELPNTTAPDRPGADPVTTSRTPWFGVERIPFWVIVVGSLGYATAWGWRTRPMGDSADYRLAGRVITSGWAELTDRTPGYPLVLWATGSLRGETVALFVLQLVMHAVAVGLVVDVLGSVGVRWRGRTVAAVALFAPPGMLAVVATGTEATVQLLVAAGLWAFARWYRTRGLPELVAVGALFAALTWVRPAYAPVVLAAAAVTWFVVRPASPRRQAAVLAAVLVPAVVGVGLLVGVQTVRFDHAGLTPLTGWYLGSRTSGYVERLPERYEPARSILVAERDRQLLLGGEVDAPNYSFAVREELQRALDMDRAELDRYVLGLHLHLIVHHPFEYQASVMQAAVRYLDIDSQPGVSRLPEPVAWTAAVVHLAVVALFVAQLLVTPGLALARRLRGRPWGIWCYSMAVSGAVMAVSVMTETGTPRLRTPTEPLLVVAMVVGWSALWRVRAADGEDDADDADPDEALVSPT